MDKDSSSKSSSSSRSSAKSLATSSSLVHLSGNEEACRSNPASLNIANPFLQQDGPGAKICRSPLLGSQQPRNRAMEVNNARVVFASRALNVFFLVVCCWACPAFCIVNDKCSACKAVALELEESLVNERPRNHLDYRHRLDSKGQREGKVIDYRVSELRVVDLLDGLCAKMKPYVPNKADSGREFWLKVEGGVPDAPEMAFNRQATELHSRAIVEFCGRLLETTEEELTEKIRVGEVATGDVERVLCQELSKSCEEASESVSSADDVEELEDDEVGSGGEGDSIKEKAKESATDTINYGSDGEL